MRKIFLMLTLALVTTSVQAQFTLKVPQWNKFVKINSQGINLRKSPSMSSSILRYSEQFFGCPEFSWGPKAGYEPFSFSAGTVLPVIKETQEWYCLYLGVCWYEQFQGCYEVYVQKRNCTVINPVLIAPDDFFADGEIERVAGETGFQIGVFFLGSPSREAWATIGHQVGNYYVGAHYPESGMEFVSQFCSREDYVLEFNSSKVSEAHVRNFLRSHGTPHVFDIWVKFPGSRVVGKYTIDSSTYAYEMRTYTYPQTTSSASSNRGTSGTALTTEDNDRVFEVVEQMPQFPGGDSALTQWIGSHMINPCNETGRIVATFVIEKDGRVNDVRIVKSVSPCADEVFVNVLESMPKWSPGRQNGQKVRVKYTIPCSLRSGN